MQWYHARNQYSVKSYTVAFHDSPSRLACCSSVQCKVMSNSSVCSSLWRGMDYVPLPPPQAAWRRAHGLPHRRERARSLRAGCQSHQSVLQELPQKSYGRFSKFLILIFIFFMKRFINFASCCGWPYATMEELLEINCHGRYFEAVWVEFQMQWDRWQS